MKNKDEIVRKKIIAYCEDIERLMMEYNNDFDLYQSKIAFQYACNMCIIQIGELVTRLSDEFKERHQDIPWKSIKAMRNIHAHDYENVDLEVVWNTLKHKIPELKAKMSGLDADRKEE